MGTGLAFGVNDWPVNQLFLMRSNNPQFDIINIQRAGINVMIHAQAKRAVLKSHTEIPNKASAASNWFDAPKMFQKTFHTGTSAPEASVRRMLTIGTAIEMAAQHPYLSRQPVSAL